MFFLSTNFATSKSNNNDIMKQIILDLTKEEETEIFGGISYVWIYRDGRYIQIPINS